MAAASGFKVPDPTRLESFFPLFGVPFVLIGLGMLSSPFWCAGKALRTVYVLTDRRAILLDGGAWGGVTVRSILPGRMVDLRRTQYPDGSGNLILGNQPGAGGQNGATLVDFGFMSIRDVKEVEDRVRELIRRADVRQE